MKLYVVVQDGTSAKRISERKKTAEYAVATQVERDCRVYIPSKRIALSGKVYGRVIKWDAPLTRMMYFGKLYVDPKYHVGGFPTPDGWRSRPGVSKVRSSRDIHFTKGGPFWFSRAKEAHLDQWIKLARKELTNG